MNPSRKLAGKRAAVTGSGTGIGREIALELARQGVDVVLHYSHSGEGAGKAVEAIEALGHRAAAFPADFRKLDEVERFAGEALAFLGGIDCLVNNAGITMNLPFERVTAEQFDTLYQVNVRAPFFLTQRLARSMKERGGGAVCNLASIHGFEGMQEHSAYAGTKGAIIAWTRSLAIELAPAGIRVNAVAPGAVVVENYYKAIPGFDAGALGPNIPAGFAGEPLDIARVVAFLLSEEARYIIGQTLIVDGGTTSWMPFGDGFRQPLHNRFGRGYVPGI
ncbi:MAG: SDR family oxidoreductase [Planctomycetes bacterium]|nr:SDR family oxidoreductase [Planctomycetota bacterium]